MHRLSTSILIGVTLGCASEAPKMRPNGEPTQARSSVEDLAVHNSPHSAILAKTSPDARVVTLDPNPDVVAANDYPSTAIGFWDPLPQVQTKAVASAPNKPISPEERERAISVVRQHLYSDRREPEGIDYNVVRKDSGFSVGVNLAMVPGGHCLVLVSDDFKIVEIIPGA